MSVQMKYEVALVKDGGATTYGSTEFMAANNLEAIEKAKDWTATFTPVAGDTWLQINLNGIGIRRLRPGEF